MLTLFLFIFSLACIWAFIEAAVKRKHIDKNVTQNAPQGTTYHLNILYEDDNVTVFEVNLNGIDYTCTTHADPRNFKPGDTMEAKVKNSTEVYTLVCAPDGKWDIKTAGNV